MAKYLQSVDRAGAENRIRLLRLMESITVGARAVCCLTEPTHSAGSPMAQKIMIGRSTDTVRMKKAAEKLSGIRSQAYFKGIFDVARGVQKEAYDS